MRLIAVIVFGLLFCVGLTVWIFNAAFPHGNPVASVEGFAAFLFGCLGLLLVDIADNLARIVKRHEAQDSASTAALDRELQAKQAAKLADAAAHKRRGESVFDPVPPDYQTPKHSLR